MTPAIEIGLTEVSAPKARIAWSKLFVPSMADLLALAVLAWLFLAGPYGWQGLLADGDTGWHIRTGEQILDTGRVPVTDPYSFSKSGQPWYAWEWLADVGLALVYRAAHLKGVVLTAACVIVGCLMVLFRHLIWAGSNLFVALAVALLAIGASTLHFLARPHLVTMLFLAAALWLLDRDRRTPTRWIWALVPATALWTNLHGGFLSLIACLGLMAVGSLLERRVRAAVRYGALAAACGAASLVNPYGWELHLHVAAYLRSDWIRQAVQEFRAPTFRSENEMQFQLLLLLGLITVGFLIRRREFVPALLILFWAHSALGSVRHVTLYSIVVAPYLAREITRLWNWWVEGASRNSIPQILNALTSERVAGFRWNSAWAALPVLLLAAGVYPQKWPADFPDKLMPTAFIARHSERLAEARVFTTDEWADYLLYRNHPRQRVFFDGRSDFYGPELGREYLALSQGRYDWKAVLDRHRIDAVLSPVDWGLASLLKISPQWTLVEDDGKALLFYRKSPVNQAAVGVAALMVLPETAEISQEQTRRR